MTSSEHPMGETTAEELLPDFGQHNMFVFGRDTVFLSHLPMFMEPHDAQLILEVTLGDAVHVLQAARQYDMIQVLDKAGGLMAK